MSEHIKKEGLIAETAVTMKVKRVGEVLMGPKHKAAGRCAILDHVTEEIITDKNKILSTTLKYNIGVLTKNKVAEQDLPEVKSKNELHEQVMNDTTKGEPLSMETYKTVLKHLKKKKKNMFCHIKNWCQTARHIRLRKTFWPMER